MTDAIHMPWAMVGGIGTLEVLLILVVALMLFGGKGLPNIAKGMGRAMREFKRATSEVESELKRAIEDEPVERRPPPPRRVSPPADRTKDEKAQSPQEPET